jgi:hypothetical protein
MANDVEFQFSHLTFWPKWLLAAKTRLPVLGNGAWDMTGFSSGGFGNPSGTGAGQHTVTVDGKVFDQYAVNYWLAGLIYNSLNEYSSSFAFQFEYELFGYVSVASLISRYVNGSFDSLSEKIAWFEAGVADDPSLPVSPPWLAGVLPGPAGPKKITWTWGSLNGKD